MKPGLLDIFNPHLRPLRLLRPLRPLRHFLALALILVLIACKGQPSMLPPPETYFTGKQLELARLVDTADAEAIYRFAMGMGLEELNAYGKENMTVLAYAATKPPAETHWYAGMTALIRAGADPQQKVGPTTGSFLNLAVGEFEFGKNLSLLKSAMDGGINPDTAAYTEESSPLLIQVASQDGLPAIKLLVEHGANVNIRDSIGDVPISNAMRTLGLAEVEYLLDKGADPVQAVNYYGVSFAHLLDNKIKNLETLKDSRLSRAYAIRDRIIQKGVKWPPESPEQFRARYIAQYKQKTGKTFVFMPNEDWEQFFPKYTPAPVRKVPLAPR